ncbi:hypothetical protein SMD11_1024 [Streptomyces albireticuli]|uniref:Tyr recombinase domain-containing protein n=1 Tax=Streptomyces albireticuli TaxID=1940 RepID=A0A1Z2KXC4_9ACTN|nr:hypothetical protein [Streptomyces albireticuli]ARZ66688.1 hypothetical protein SMD11_1024 [Streptomyces albireticuli]
MPHPSITALEQLISGLSDGSSRQRQLGMVRQELTTALELDILPGDVAWSLARLLDEVTLRRYVQVAKTGTLRSRLVAGEKPPTSEATNVARLACLQILREAAGLPALAAGSGGPVELRPTPERRQLRDLRRRLRRDVSRIVSPGHARLIAVLAVALDTRARAGELAAQHIGHLSDDHSSIHVTRRPQHGTDIEPDRELVSLSSLSRDALAQWLPIRLQLTETLEGSATALWVSLAYNHAGTTRDDGSHTRRRHGMPLQQRGLIRSYNSGRHRYGLAHFLPPKLEQLRRALERESAGH